MQRIELHLHTMYSFLDGVGTPEEYVKRAKKFGMKAIGITDHGSACGLFHFYTACVAEDVKPILGVEFYTTPEFMTPEKKIQKKIKRLHIAALAKNYVGYKNLLKLTYLGYQTFNRRPLIKIEDLFAHKEGLIVCTACIASSVTTEELFVRFKQEFGDDFYAEIQPLDLSTDWNREYKRFEKLPNNPQIEHNTKMILWAKKHGVRVVHTLDVHYPDEEDKKIQDIFILNSFVGKSGWHFASANHWLMDAETAWNQFVKFGHDKLMTREEFDQTIVNSHEIADKVEQYDLERKPQIAPFPVEQHPLGEKGLSPQDLLLRIIECNGKMLKGDIYFNRLLYELKIIKQKGFVDYFLIIEDIVRWCRVNNILVGPGRGSAGGSLLAYALDITKVDPIKYDMPFERFLDISRTDYPDIDLDFSDQDTVFKYVKEKYGEDRVLRVGIFQGIKTKTAIKDAYRVLRKDTYDFTVINKVTKDIPASGSGVNEKEWFEKYLWGGVECGIQEEPGNAELQQFFVENQDVYKATIKMLGKIKINKVHPCAIVIAPSQAIDYVPIVINGPNTTNAFPMTGYDGTYLEKSGLIKLDILSLNTLRDIQRCVALLKKRRNIDIDIYQLEPTDKRVLEKFKEGDTESVFQFNTPIATGLLQGAKADTFNDLAIITAIGRPGAYRAGKTNMLYIDRKLGRKAVTYMHPALEPILKNTYGLMIYQEQIMRIFQDLGGLTAVEANRIRKVISKFSSLKQEDKDHFIQYATTKLDPPMMPESAKQLLDLMSQFATYCFNRSHAVCYSYIGYICQYLKTYYPLEWWAAVLQNASTEDLKIFIESKKNQFLRDLLIYPEINESEYEFKLNDRDKLVMPLTFVNQVAEKAIEAIKVGQPYKNFKDFFDRVDKRAVKRNTIDNLIFSNAFRGIEPDKSIRDLIMYFYYLRDEDAPTKFINIDNAMSFEELKRDALTIYRTNWTERFKILFNSNIISDYKEIPAFDGQEVVIGGMIEQAEKCKTKTNKDFYRLKVKNGDDVITVYVWSDIIPMVREFMIPNIIVEIVGQTSKYGLALDSIRRVVV